MAAVELNAHINPANPQEIVLKVGEMTISTLGVIREPEDGHDEYNVIQESVGNFLSSVLQGSGNYVPQMSTHDEDYYEEDRERRFSKGELFQLLQTAQSQGMVDSVSASNLRRELEQL